MPSALNPESECRAWQYAVGHTLITASPAIEDRCAARWKVQSLSCDVLVHAHDGADCGELVKLRLVADQAHAPLIVLHSDDELTRCYDSQVSESPASLALSQHIAPTRIR